MTLKEFILSIALILAPLFIGFAAVCLALSLHSWMGVPKKHRVVEVIYIALIVVIFVAGAYWIGQTLKVVIAIGVEALALGIALTSERLRLPWLDSGPLEHAKGKGKIALPLREDHVRPSEGSGSPATPEPRTDGADVVDEGSGASE